MSFIAFRGAHFSRVCRPNTVDTGGIAAEQIPSPSHDVEFGGQARGSSVSHENPVGEHSSLPSSSYLQFLLSHSDDPETALLERVTNLWIGRA